jgi:hypothetical protein
MPSASRAFHAANPRNIPRVFVNLIREMLDLLPAFFNLGHGFNPNLEVNIRPILRDHKVRSFGFNALGCGRHVRHQQQRAPGNLVVMPDNKNCGGFHVYANASQFLQPLEKHGVMLPESAVGGVNHASAVIQTP